jgi:hypothetical protein
MTFVADTLEKLSRVLPGGDEKDHFECDLGHKSFASGHHGACYRCGGVLRYVEQRHYRWGTAYETWKANRDWVPQRLSQRRDGKEVRYWRFMGRDWLPKEGKWLP